MYGFEQTDALHANSIASESLWEREMEKKNNMRISTRMQILVGLTLIGLITLCLAALMQLKGTMLDDRKQKTRNLVEVGLGTLAYYNKLAEDGKLSMDAAKSAARDALRGLRYDTSDYFFIIDSNLNYILVPPKPESEGKNASEVKDTNGKMFFQELVAAGQRGGGFVDYVYPRPGQQKSEPKLSYAGNFAPWGWVLGTGIYIDDVETEYWIGVLTLGGISALLLVALSLIGWRVSAGILRQLGGEPEAQIQQVEVKTTLENLVAALGDEIYEIDSMYPRFLVENWSAGNSAARTFTTSGTRTSATLRRGCLGMAISYTVSANAWATSA